jgi:hypothetical protein
LPDLLGKDTIIPGCLDPKIAERVMGVISV